MDIVGLYLLEQEEAPQGPELAPCGLLMIERKKEIRVSPQPTFVHLWHRVSLLLYSCTKRDFWARHPFYSGSPRCGGSIDVIILEVMPGASKLPAAAPPPMTLICSNGQPPGHVILS